MDAPARCAEDEEVAAGVSRELTGSWTLVAVDTSPFPEVGKTPTLAGDSTFIAYNATVVFWQW